MRDRYCSFYEERRNELIKRALADADLRYNGKTQVRKWNRLFYRRMTELAVEKGLISPNNLVFFEGDKGR